MTSAKKAALILIGIGGLIAPTFANASRSVVSPPYMRRIIFTFLAPSPSPNYADGTPIGMQMSVQITLNNLSNTTQTGSLLMTGYAAGGEVARTTVANVHLSTCNGATGVGADGGPSSSSVPFSIAPNGQAVLGVVALLTSTFAIAGDPGMVQFDAQFNPTLKITINEDRGAINATMVPEWDTAGGTSCDGISMTKYSSAYDVSESRTGVPLLINGGRPF